MPLEEFFSDSPGEGDLVGAVLADRFRIDSLLGRGAMGSVFCAQNLKLDRTVALKLLHRSLLEPRALQRFMKEAYAVSRLHHPNVVKVFSSGEIDGRPFIEMELVGGESLDEVLLREGKLPMEKAISIVSDAARGLAHAHEMGMIHRDIKPSNIMLTPQSDGGMIVRVVDFGTAKVLQREGGSEQNLTATHGTIGTPHYMSPEQCSSRELDARSDIYSLGCVLYQLLSGQTPVQAETPYGAMLGHIQGEIKPLPASFPEWIISVVNKSVCTERMERFQSMDDFIAALSAREIVFAAAGSSVKSQSSRHYIRLTVVMFCVALTILLIGVWAVKPPVSTPLAEERQKELLLSEIEGLKRQLPEGKDTPSSPQVLKTMHNIASRSAAWLALVPADIRPPGKVQATHEWFVAVATSKFLPKDQTYDLYMEMSAIPGLAHELVAKYHALAMKDAVERAKAAHESGESAAALMDLDRAKIAGDRLVQQPNSQAFAEAFPYFRQLGLLYGLAHDGKKSELVFSPWEKGVAAKAPGSMFHAEALCCVAAAMRLQGKMADAEKLEATALAIAETQAAGQSRLRAVAFINDNIGRGQYACGLMAGAEKTWRQSLMLLQQRGASPAEIAGVRFSLAEALASGGISKLDQAAQELNIGLDNMTPGPEGRVRFAQIAKSLGDGYKRELPIRLDKAQWWYRRGLEVVGPVDTAAGRANIFWLRLGLADALLMSQDPSAALHVLEACTSAKVPADFLAEAYRIKAGCQCAQQNYKDAAETDLVELALRIKSKARPVLLSMAALRTAQAFNSLGNKVERDKYLKLAREYALGDRECLDKIEKCTK